MLRAAKLLNVGKGLGLGEAEEPLVEDDKVGTDQLEEEITKFEEHVSEGARSEVQGCPT